MVLAELHDVSFTYESAESPALRSVSVTLEAGLLYGVIGLNASGKSTLCAALRGIVPHFHKGDLTGELTILGRNVLDWDPAELSVEIGYVFQNPFTQISGVKDTVFEEIALGLENLGIDRREIVTRVSQAVDQLGLWPLVERNPNELSGGQRQKVAFASIIAMDAQVLVIDEPTSQLDPESSDEVFRIIHELRSAGKSIILVEHKIDLLAQYSDRLLLLHEGKLVREGGVEEVFTSAELAAAGMRGPDVTELAKVLAAAGKPLAQVPVTLEEAVGLVELRMKGATGAN